MTWPRRYPAFVRTALGVQRETDIRNIPRVWFWRFDIEGSPEDEIYGEENLLTRKNFDPVGVHLFIREITNARGPSKAGVDFKVDLGVGIGLAEILRIGEYYSGVLKGLGRPGWEVEAEEGYIPHAGDLFQWRNGIYTVNELFKPTRHIGPTRVNMVWTGMANKAVHDSTDLSKPVPIQAQEPEQPKWPEEMRADGVRPRNP